VDDGIGILLVHLAGRGEGEGEGFFALEKMMGRERGVVAWASESDRDSGRRRL
jgi:hypothetical protein